MVIDLYSKRKKKAEMAGKTEPYKYNEIPEKFRVQVIYIWEETFNNLDKFYKKYNTSVFGLDSKTLEIEIERKRQLELYRNIRKTFWKNVHYGLVKEYGVFSLSNKQNLFEDITAFLLGTHTSNEIEMIFLSSWISRNASSHIFVGI